MSMVKIKAIRPVHRRDRYDLTVNTTKNFYANGVLIHNTSLIISRNYVKYPENWISKIARKLGVKVHDGQYEYLYASRTVIKNDALNPGFYKEDIWTIAGKKFFEGKLNTGETVYAEIVGYLPSGAMIQKGYPYGCKENTFDVYVYRITSTGLDGNVVELGWQAVKERCKELDVKHVPEYYFGRAGDLFAISENEHWHENFAQAVRETYLEKIAEDCGLKIPDEGVVIRRESKVIDVYKAKSELFYERESKAHEDGEVDVEAENS